METDQILVNQIVRHYVLIVMQLKQGVRGNSHNDYTGECMLRYYLGTLFANAFECSIMRL